MSAVANGARGVFSIFSGLQEKENLKAQAMAAEYQAQIDNLRGVQASANQREQLNRVLGSIAALRAARGLGADSPTAAAIRKDQRRRSADAEANAVLGHRLSGMANRERARGLRRAAPWAAMNGFIQGLDAFASASEGFGFGGSDG